MPVIYEGDSGGNVVVKGASGKAYRLKTYIGETSNVVPIARGGTGSNLASGARTNLGLGSLAQLNELPNNSLVYGKLDVVSNPGAGEVLSYNATSDKLEWVSQAGSGDTIVNVNQAAPDISGGTFSGDSVNIVVDSSFGAWELEIYTDSVTSVAGAGTSLVVETPPGIPTGAVFHFAMSTAPTGYLVCDGSAVSRTTYSTLFTTIGTTYGSGDDSSTFNLPELRGQFIRGWQDSNSAGDEVVIDSDRTFGSTQGDAVTDHNHWFWATSPSGGALHDTGKFNAGGTLNSLISYSDFNYSSGSDVNVRAGGNTGRGNMRIDKIRDASGTTDYEGTETRPHNVALLPCIKT